MSETPLGRPGAQQVLWRIAFFLLAGAVTLLALLPDLQVPKLGLPAGAKDLLQHFLAFALLGAAGGLAWHAPRATLAGLGVFAVLLELAQAFAPGREVHLHEKLKQLPSDSVLITGPARAGPMEGNAVRIVWQTESLPKRGSRIGFCLKPGFHPILGRPFREPAKAGPVGLD